MTLEHVLNLIHVAELSTHPDTDLTEREHAVYARARRDTCDRLRLLITEVPHPADEAQHE